jgi:hypothetical protein
LVYIGWGRGKYFEAASSCQVVARFDTAGDNDHVDIQRLFHPFELDSTNGAVLALHEVLCGSAEVYLRAAPTSFTDPKK